ncbi:MAG TPA: hypothetical protein VFC82_09280 [Actinomycetaceae bacterium]|nr:hypothetical protein [Actinomycetaceae bacterium]
MTNASHLVTNVRHGSADMTNVRPDVTNASHHVTNVRHGSADMTNVRPGVTIMRPQGRARKSM